MAHPYKIIQIERDDANAVPDLFHFFKQQRANLSHPHWMMDRTMNDFHALAFNHNNAWIWVAKTDQHQIRGMIVLRRGSVVAPSLDANDSNAQKTNTALRTAFQAAARQHTVALIECLLVALEYSQNGIAKGLIAAATNHAKQDPRITFIAANIVRDNTKSIETFEKSGFHIFAQNTRDDDQKTPRYVAGLDLSA